MIDQRVTFTVADSLNLQLVRIVQTGRDDRQKEKVSIDVGALIRLPGLEMHEPWKLYWREGPCTVVTNAHARQARRAWGRLLNHGADPRDLR